MRRLILLLVGLCLLTGCSPSSVGALPAQSGVLPPQESLAPVLSHSTKPTSTSAGALSSAPAATSQYLPPPTDTGYYSPLTGLPISKELSLARPVAVMINNIKASMPQIGISQADVIYECLAEGGITRLMALYLDYKSLPTVGSVRSARDYFLDLAQIHDAIFLHAGGSELAYSQIKTRHIDHLDGVRTTVSGVFWRDPERLKTMSREHTMVTNGEKISYGIQKKNYRTTLRQGFQSPFSFCLVPTEVNGKSATYIKIPNSSSYTAEFYYDLSSNTYKKLQFGAPHVDGANGKQLAFTNLLILYTQQSKVDSYGRIAVDLTGSGQGYYMYGGKAIPIQWQRNDRDGGITLLNVDGSPLSINRGKTYVSISSQSIINKTIVE